MKNNTGHAIMIVRECEDPELYVGVMVDENRQPAGTSIMGSSALSVYQAVIDRENICRNLRREDDES